MNEASDLKQPLIPRENNVTTWLHSYIHQGNSQTKWSSRDCTRAVSKCALAAIATLRNIAFMPVSLRLPLAGWNWASAVGNVIGVSALDFWVGNLFLNDSLPQTVGLEKVFPQKNSMSRTAANIGNVVISLLSQIPSVYPTMQYNSGPLSIPAGLVVLFGGAVLPLRSIQLSMEKYFKPTSTKEQRVSAKKQEMFIELIQANRQHFINMSPEDKMQFIATLDEIRKQEDSPEKIQAYWGHLLSRPTPSPKNTLSGTAYGSTLVAKGVGAILMGIYQYVIGEYTFAKTKENVWDNDLFAGISSGLVVASTLVLMGTAMVDSAGKLFHSIIGINKEVRLSQETLVKKLRKKTITILQALGVGINFLSLGATYVIWNEFYKNKTERIFFETTMCSAIFLLLYSAIPGVINDVEETCLSYTGSPEEKAAIKLSREYQILADSIGKISPESIETFSPHLPPNILSAITPKSSTSSPAPEQSLHTPPPLEEHSTPLHIESKNNSDSSEERPYDEDEKDEYVTVDSNILKTDEMV